MDKTPIKRDIKQRTVKGLFWSVNSKFVTHFFNLIITAILARILSPEDFGIVGMSLIIIGLVSIINESGLTTAIIQKKTLEDSHLYTAFWTNIVTGIVLYSVTFIISPLIANFFRTPYVENIIKVAALSFIISSTAIVHRSVLSRNLKFKLISVTEIVGSILSGFFALYLALSGFGLWSLVAKNIVNDVIVVVATLIVHPWRPAFKFSRTRFHELFGFGTYVIGGNLLTYFRENLDYIVIGRFMGAELLGYYTLAYTLAVFPATKIAPVITRVVFPAFSILQDDAIRFRKGYIKLVSSLALITIPSLIGLATVAPELIIQVYGDKWTPSIVPLQILCMLGLVDALSRTTRSVFYSKGHPEIELKLNAIKIVVSSVVIYMGSFYGIIGVAASLSIISLFYFAYTQSIVNSMINLTWREYLLSIKTPLLASSLMGIVIVAYKLLLYSTLDASTLLVFISSTLIGASLYFALIHIFRPDILKVIKKDIKVG